jgi:hypothetical protein
MLHGEMPARRTGVRNWIVGRERHCYHTQERDGACTRDGLGLGFCRLILSRESKIRSA